MGSCYWGGNPKLPNVGTVGKIKGDADRLSNGFCFRLGSLRGRSCGRKVYCKPICLTFHNHEVNRNGPPNPSREARPVLRDGAGAVARCPGAGEPLPRGNPRRDKVNCPTTTFSLTWEPAASYIVATSSPRLATVSSLQTRTVAAVTDGQLLESSRSITSPVAAG